MKLSFLAFAGSLTIALGTSAALVALPRDRADGPAQDASAALTNYLDWGKKDVTSGASTTFGAGAVSATPTVKGTATHLQRGGLPMTDLTLEVKRQGPGTGKVTFTGVKVGGLPHTGSPVDTPGGLGQQVTVKGLTVGQGNPGADFEIFGIDPTGAENVEVRLTASYSGLIEDVLREANQLPDFELTRTADYLRLGLASAWHDTMFVHVGNGDTVALIGLSGQVHPPAGSSAQLLSVHLMTVSGGNLVPVPGATGSVDAVDMTFSIASFPPIPSEEDRLLVFVFDEPIGGRLLRIGIEAEFDEES